MIWSDFAQWSDSQDGHYSWDMLTGPATGVELFADGESLGESSWFGEGVWNVPAGERDYELVYDLRHYLRSFSTWTTPHTSETRWTFRSRDSAEPQTLPLLFPDYDLDVDLTNTASADRRYPVRIGFEPNPGYEMGRLTSAKAWVSYDEGETWERLPVVLRRKNLTATVDNLPAAGGAVSLKVKAVDAHGVGVTQSINRLYRVE